MSPRFLAPLAALALLGAVPVLAPTELVVRPVLEGGAFKAMDVAVSFSGEMDGETVLDLPDDWGGERELWKALRDIRVDGATMSPGAGAAHRVLRHTPGARVTVRYRVVQDANGPPESGNGNDYRPLIQPTYFQLLGNAIVALPADARMRGPATFRIEGMPAGASFASDLEHGALGRRLTVLDLAESVMVGGDFRVLDAGGGVRIAIRGAWPRDDAGWRVTLARIGASQRAYWGARAEPYLVTILPLSLGPDSTSIGGTGRNDAFAFFATTNVQAERFDGTLAHEMMHTWIPGRIGAMAEADEQLTYWLSEGFTDWGAFRAMVRGGLWSPAQFAEAFNERLEAYDLSPVRTAPNARILAAFWSSQEVQKLPYHRGMLLATLWDHRIRVASRGRKDLDDVLLQMQRTAQRRPDLTADKILPVVMRVTGGVEIGVDLTTLVQEGGVVALPADIFAPCGSIVSERRHQWERGFDFDATRRADWAIAGVAPDSNAYAAGLRNGMQLRQWSERSDQRDATKTVTAGVSDQGVARSFTWLPAGREEREIRKLVLDPVMDGPACVKRLSG